MIIEFAEVKNLFPKIKAEKVVEVRLWAEPYDLEELRFAGQAPAGKW